MVMILDFFVLFLSMILLIINIGLIPIVEINEVLLPYANVLFYGIIVIFAIKYLVYEIQAIRDIRYIQSNGQKTGAMDLAVLFAYPMCDILRMLVAIGVVASILSNKVRDYMSFDPVISHIILVVIVLVIIFVDYFSKDSESILPHLIPTAAIVLVALILTKDMIFQGLQLF